MDPALHVAQWLGAAFPTVIYHHGNNERPFDYGKFGKNTFKGIFLAQSELFEANLINLSAPFHRSLKLYLEKVRYLDHFTALLMVSVRLMEHLVGWLKAQGCPCVLVAGASLGGWVTNLNRATYNSADTYVPLLAGAALGEIFVCASYRRLAGRAARANPEAVLETLNFEEAFASVSDDNVYPLLARYDRIIEFERQSRCYHGRHPITVLDKGHVTALAFDDLRRHILRQLAAGLRAAQD